MQTDSIPESPLYRDPMFDGATDPVLIWNHKTREWWMFYTSRRANVNCAGVSWVYGSDIGVATSVDGGRTWSYRGVAQGLDIEAGRNTFWAPEIVFHDGTYHMYVSYIRGVWYNWANSKRILHYESQDLWNWTYRSTLPLSSEQVIDACVARLDDGNWRLWYKDERNGAHTYSVDSEDLVHWSDEQPVITDCAHEGPNVFLWEGSYWMITDVWSGLAVYRSSDAKSWTRQEGNILSEPGTRKDDNSYGYHADVVVQGDGAYVVYFTHPGRTEESAAIVDECGITPYKQRRSAIQVAKLSIDGNRLVCDRNKPFAFRLLPPSQESATIKAV